MSKMKILKNDQIGYNKYDDCVWAIIVFLC